MNGIVRRIAASIVSAGLAGAALLAGSPANAAPDYGPYLFISNSSHLCMDVVGGDRASGARIQQWYCWGGAPQRWTEEYVMTIGVTHYYRLRNLETGKCLDVPGGDSAPGVLLQQWDCWADARQGYMQLWAVETQPFSPPVPTSRVKNLMTGRCVDDKDWSNTPGTLLQQWTCEDTPPQQWHIP
ncbi:RICIN domain-containing protein [Amycolatopsis sp. NPDC004772]